MSRLHNLMRIKASTNWPPPPTDLLPRLREAYDLGLSVSDLAKLSCKGSSLDGVSKPVHRRLLKLSGEHGGVRCAIRSLFLRGTLDQRLGAPHKAHRQCAAQQELSLAVTLLPASSAFALRGAASVMPIDRQAWSRSYAGAVGFARAAHALKGAGALFMPSPVADIEDKIDLVLEMPTVVLCLTIKTDATASDTSCAVIEEGFLRSGMETYLFRFASSVSAFGARHGGATCIPVYLRVGTATELWSVDPRACRSVARGVSDLLARFSGT